MLTGAEIAKLARWGLCVVLVACGGRTLDDGVYGANGASSDGSSCTYRGKTYADGSAVTGSCFCFCNRGQIECETGCSSPDGGASSGGNSGRVSTGATTSSGATTSVGGFGGTASGGAAGSSATGATGNIGATGGIATAGSSSGGAAGAAGAASGGSAGYGGALITCPIFPPSAAGLQPSIDTMEDGDAFISPFEGRQGIWYTYNDGTIGAAQLPAMPLFTMQKGALDPTGGFFVANTAGKGFTSWGAGMGFTFNNGCPYDATVYSGLKFFVKSEYGAPALQILLGTAATTPTGNGGFCTGTCYDDFEMTIQASPTWSLVVIPFEAFNQEGWGTPAVLESSMLINVNFQTMPYAAQGFSYSIDSVSFF